MGQILADGIITNSLPRILISLGLTFVLSLLIAWTYKRTHRGVSYSQSFVFTLIIMSVVTALIMMVIANNLALAFGLLGALSIIRFRTPVKDTRDTSFIFFALGIGMAAGTGNYFIAVVGTVVVLMIIWILSKTNFGSMKPDNYLLTFLVLHDQGGERAFESIFKKYLKSSLLLNINSKQDGKASEMTYSANFVDKDKTNDFVKELAGIQGIDRVHLITSTDDVEY